MGTRISAEVNATISSADASTARSTRSMTEVEGLKAQGSKIHRLRAQGSRLRDGLRVLRLRAQRLRGSKIHRLRAQGSRLRDGLRVRRSWLGGLEARRSTGCGRRAQRLTDSWLRAEGSGRLTVLQTQFLRGLEAQRLRAQGKSVCVFLCSSAASYFCLCSSVSVCGLCFLRPGSSVCGECCSAAEMLSNSRRAWPPPRKTPRPRTRSTRTAPAARYGFLTVGQTARIIGVSPSTLRLWESEGLVAPIRTSGRYRLYSPELLKLLKRIKYLREVQRLNMPGIKRELRGGTRAGRRAPQRRARSGPPIGRSARSCGKMRERKGLEPRGRGEARRHLAGLPERRRALARQRLGRDAAASRHHLRIDRHRAVPHAAERGPARRPRRSPRAARASGCADGAALDGRADAAVDAVPRGAARRQRGLLFASGRGVHLHARGLARDLARRAGVPRAHEGDSFWFESMHAHRWMNPGGTEAVLLWINTPPTF